MSDSVMDVLETSDIPALLKPSALSSFWLLERTDVLMNQLQEFSFCVVQSHIFRSSSIQSPIWRGGSGIIQLPVFQGLPAASLYESVAEIKQGAFSSALFQRQNLGLDSWSRKMIT